MKKIMFLIVAAVSVIGMLAISGCGKERVYTVTFDANGGTGEMKEQIFVKDVYQTLVSNEFVCELKSFSGWNTIPDGSGVTYSDGQEIAINNDITLYAQWEQAVFKITFAANGGTGSMAPVTIEIGKGKYLPENTFTRSGYIFYGWATSATGKVEYSDKGSIGEIAADLTLYAQWTKPEVGKQAVDLGLPSGVLWASCNVGADNPEEFGSYYAWGETESKETYSWSNYRYCVCYNGYTRLTKYCYDSNYGYNGFSDNLTTLEAIDDAATANWGGAWRMPTKEDFEELINNCINAVTTYNGVKGRAFVGSNNKSIFLPGAGCKGGTYGNYPSTCLYWSSSLSSCSQAWLFYSNGLSDGAAFNFRYSGLTIRPVCTQ